MDLRSIGGGQVSKRRITSLLQPLRDDLNRINQRLDNPPPEMPQRSIPDQDDRITPGIWLKHYWGLKWRRLPEGRKMSVLTAAMLASLLKQ
jgi:hypothetical protein